MSSLAVSVSLSIGALQEQKQRAAEEGEREEREERTEVWQAVFLFSISLAVCLSIILFFPSLGAH